MTKLLLKLLCRCLRRLRRRRRRNTMDFDRFVGVDWSGARGPGLPGLQVAMATAGRCPPRLVPPPDGRKNWTRSVFADWLVKTLSGNDRVLVGLDFAFSFPRRDTGEFFPGVPDPDAPSTACDLWRRVDKICEDTEDFYAGTFIEDERYAPYFQGGDQYEHRLRMTDERCDQKGWGRPETVFKLVGPTQVGKGSLAGMRVLHHLRREVSYLCIWPFDRLPRSRSVDVVVEVYPGAFVHKSKVTNGNPPSRPTVRKAKVHDMETLNRIMEFYDSEPLRDDVLEGEAAGDKADALIVAAALRRLSRKGKVWNPPGLCDARRWHEGWIFGVT